MEPAWALALEASFGSVERWRDEFVAMACAPAGDRRWVRLVFQPNEGTLVNRAADRSHTLGDGVPLLVLDMDARTANDDGARAAAAVDAFMNNIDWSSVYARYRAAVDAASEPFGATPEEAEGVLLLDVRRAGVYEQTTQAIQGARWFDPARVSTWAADVPAGRDIVVYCVYGHEVGRCTALRLRAAGLNARFLRGGIEAWRATGRTLVAKTAGSPSITTKDIP